VDEGTSLLFDLDGFRVVSIVASVDGAREVMVEGIAGEQACPRCGVFSARVHQRWVQTIKDLPYGPRPLVVRWRKRRWACDEPACRTRTFSERTEQVERGRRLTRRLRDRLEQAVSAAPRAAWDVAREYRVSWWSVNQALIAKAARVVGPAPAGVRLLGVDETRARSVRWLADEAGWRRSDPWMTSFVDLDPAHPRGLLGLAPGRSGATVRGWLALQSAEFRAGIETVAIDPSAPFAAALRDRTLLPNATLVVDHWHLHRLANQMVTEVRQRVTQQVHGHRGRKTTDVWAYRRLLLRAGAALSRRQWRRLRSLFAEHDPTGEILAAWAGKECLRELLDAVDGGVRAYEIRRRLERFYQCAADADVPELTRLAETIETWWPAVLAFLQLRITNARTEGLNRTIKTIKRVGCGYRNQHNYERRIMLHSAARAA
jgi:transposase